MLVFLEILKADEFSYTEWLLAVIISLLFFGAYFTHWAISQMWIKGIVPKTVQYSEDNLFKIYMSLAVLMIKVDRRNVSEKKSYLQNYFGRKYGVDNYDLHYTFAWAFTNEKIRIKSATNWMNKKIPDIGYQSQLLYFLAGIAIIDGNINKRERQVLDTLAKDLSIPEQEIEAIIASYLEAEYRKRKAQNREKYRNHRPTQIKRKQMAKILEISENASFEEIKKAYRRMVKLHHPDRFQQNGSEQIKLAQERFIEIQLAYEYFEKLLN